MKVARTVLSGGKPEKAYLSRLIHKFGTPIKLKKILKAAKETLSGKVGVYSIICNLTNARYIGSSIDIGNRLVRHLVVNNTNEQASSKDCYC